MPRFETGELFHPEQVAYDTSARRPHYFINCICGSQCSAGGGVFFSPPLSSVCAGKRLRPSTHGPRMQSGRPSESSSPRHRWGKYNSAIGSLKVASGPLLSEVFGSLPLSYFLMKEERKSGKVCWKQCVSRVFF